MQGRRGAGSLRRMRSRTARSTLTHPLLAGLLATLAIALVALSPVATAGAETRELTVDVTGIHVDDWRHADSGYPERCRFWTFGRGSQTIGLRTVRPVRYQLFRSPGGARWFLAPVSVGRWAGSVQRSGSWEDHAPPPTAECQPCGPLSEYGECGEELPPVKATWDCRRRKLRSPLALLGLGQALVVRFGGGVSFTDCPPDLGGRAVVELRLARPRQVSFSGAPLRKLLALGKGGSLTLKGSAEASYVNGRTRGACARLPLVVGDAECAVTDVTVEVRRTR